MLLAKCHAANASSNNDTSSCLPNRQRDIQHDYVFFLPYAANYRTSKLTLIKLAYFDYAVKMFQVNSLSTDTCYNFGA